MQFSTLIAALAAVAVLPAMALPAAEPEALTEPVGVEKRANTVFVCEKDNWSGRCVTYTPEWNKCMPWSALGLSGLGSWGPSSGTYCILYNHDCGVDGTSSDTFTYPGLNPVPGYWKSNTHAWKCWW